MVTSYHHPQYDDGIELVIAAVKLEAMPSNPPDTQKQTPITAGSLRPHDSSQRLAIAPQDVACVLQNLARVDTRKINVQPVALIFNSRADCS
jgi:hypothetical protein